MPYPNEHACRVKEPSNYTQFARKQIAPGISMVLGIKNGKSETQAYRFNIKNYTVQAARKWLDDHNITCTEFAGATGVKAKKGDTMKKRMEACHPSDPDGQALTIILNKLGGANLSAGFQAAVAQKKGG